jgi:crotonobetaine/carnitine-CoA ligase
MTREASATREANATDLAMRSVLGRDRGTMIDFLEARAALHGEATFLSWRGEGSLQKWTYAEAWEEVRRTAAGWRALGCQPGTRIASYASNCPNVVWAWFGAQAAGAVWVAINRKLLGNLLSDQLGRSEASLLVTETGALPELQALELDVSKWTIVLVDKPAPSSSYVLVDELRKAEPRPLDPQDPDAVQLISYTSGSTGRTKAARLPNFHMIRHGVAYAQGFGLGRTDVTFGWNPLFHMGGVMMESLGGGLEHALYPNFSASRFWHEVRESGATYLLGFPVVVKILLGMPESPRDRDHSLRKMFCVGLDEKAESEAEERFGFTIVNAYGGTEAEAVTVPLPTERQPRGSCGLLHPDWRAQLVDDRGAQVELGEIGEMLVRPTVPGNLFQGYEGDAEATVNAWRDLWYRTGDLFRQDDRGYFYFAGRKAHRLRRRGENISEVELRQLLESHPAVSEVCVVAVPSEMGEDEIKCAIQLVEGEELDVVTYHEWCVANIPQYMLPRYYLLCDELPRLPLGKADVREVRDRTDGVVDILALMHSRRPGGS